MQIIPNDNSLWLRIRQKKRKINKQESAVMDFTMKRILKQHMKSGTRFSKNHLLYVMLMIPAVRAIIIRPPIWL